MSPPMKISSVGLIKKDLSKMKDGSFLAAAVHNVGVEGISLLQCTFESAFF